MKRTMDGNEAAAYASYAFTEVAAIYPITPSSPMAEYVDAWAANGMKNIFGKPVKLVEMQSEAGAISACHGAMEAGVLTSTYTASQGLLLMVPTMYRIAGMLKPGVIHVASRSVALHGYSINAEHSDVMSCRQTGYAMIASSSVQEAMDLAAVAHLASIKSSIPFLHFFDGFRTSHEIQKIDCLDFDELAKLVDYEALDRFRKKSLNPDYPVIRTCGQTPEIFFQSREACEEFYQPVPDIIEEYMTAISKLTGRNYRPFNYYGDPEAETVLIAMGSVSGTAQETVKYLTEKGRKVGYIEVHMYRPWSMKHFLKALPKSAKTIVVLDRTKENGALADPLYEDIAAAMAETDMKVKLLAGRYGIGGKDTTPTQIAAVYDNAESASPMNHFVVGINDDVLHRSLPLGEKIVISQGNTKGCVFWGLGSDGTVGANKNSIKIIGDFTDKYIQAYFEYDGKKSGGLTKSHLRFGDEPIKSSYYVTNADFVACHKQSFIHKYDMWSELRPGGAFLLNTNWTGEELDKNLPTAFKQYMAKNRCRFYVIDATEIAKEIGLGNRTNTILQAAFFKISDIIPIDEAVQHMKDFALKSYGMKGENIVQMNYAAIDKGVGLLEEYPVPEEWAEAKGWEPEEIDPSLPFFVKNVLFPVVERKGNEIPVSTFKTLADGNMPVGTSKYELRGIAVDVPVWDPTACIQCNRCAYVCPVSTIRPFLTEEGKEGMPETVKKTKANGKAFEGFNFTIQVDPLDCVGCGSCANVCPKKGQALVMKPLETQLEEQSNWNYLVNLPERTDIEPTNVKNSQFRKPLLEFPGCCAGCGETPYVKVVTQLFGDRMTVATATGCAAVWATEYPIGPYTTNSKGRGPAMANSLFENNGEFGFGMRLGSVALREYMKDKAGDIAEVTENEALKKAALDWADAFDDGAKTIQATDAFLEELEKVSPDAKEADDVAFILKNKEHLTRKSTWIIGGDGWAYDIGYGGLDHILASGEDVNILVLDTEVYSNTGGQASKASQKGAVAQFAAAGRKTPKKDLGMMAMAYGNVYVASVAMGADYEQYLKVLKEAESYKGPSLIIAYAPCINHGIKAGMGNTMNEMKKAVDCGYWLLYRYDPRRAAEGQNPLILDSKEPQGDYQEFLAGEVRFASLKRAFPDEAVRLDTEAEAEAKAHYEKYKELAQ